jgi:hypothetical protein
MRTIEISEETYEKIREQLGEEITEINSFSDLVGGKYFFRTVTYHLLGNVVKQIGNFLELENASWIADSGRFMNFIKEGTVNEVEPVGHVWINMSSVVDFYPWKHKLFTEQK